MKLYLNKDYIKEISNGMSTDEILNEIEERLEGEIIEKIVLNDVEVNIDYFIQNEIDMNNLNEIKFVTKKVNLLIEETLISAGDYLKKLKKAIYKIAELYREGEQVEASNLLKGFIDGIEWYTNILESTLTLINKKDFNEKGKQLLNDFNTAITRNMLALNNEDYSYFADIFETQTARCIEEIQEFNKEILEFNSK